MRALTDYGLKVKMNLLISGKTQEQLINAIKKQKPEIYVDASLLRKIFTGEVKQSALIPIINEILDLNVEKDGTQ